MKFRILFLSPISLHTRIFQVFPILSLFARISVHPYRFVRSVMNLTILTCLEWSKKHALPVCAWVPLGLWRLDYSYHQIQHSPKP